MKTCIFFAAVLLAAVAAMLATPAGSGDEVYVKVVRVDRAAGELEAKFVIVPLETRIVLGGEVPTDVQAGDYLKLKFSGPDIAVGKAKLQSKKVIWKFSSGGDK